MECTSLTLLQSLQQSNPFAWERFVDAYSLFIRGFFDRAGIRDDEDLVQDVLMGLSQNIERFVHRGNGSFRAWIATCVRHRICDFFRERRIRNLSSVEESFLAQLDDEKSDLNRAWEAEYTSFMSRKILDFAQMEFGQTEFQAFYQTAILERDVDEVANALRIGKASVYSLKCRVMSRLREYADCFLGDSRGAVG